MNLRQLLGFAPRQQKAPIGLFNDASATQGMGLFSGILPGGIGNPPIRGSREFLAAYSHMPWLRAIVDKLSGSVAATEWKLYAKQGSDGRAKAFPSEARSSNQAARTLMLKALKQTGELREIPRHPFYDLLATGNDYLTGLSMRKVTNTHIEILGEAFWLKERNAAGVVIGAWPIPPHWVQTTPTPSKRIYRVQFRGWRAEVPDTEMLWFCDPNPENPYARGTGMGMALGDEFESDEYAARTTKQFYFNNARPDLIVSGPSLSERQTNQLQEEWNAKHKGFWNRFKTHFLSGDIKITELDHDFRQGQFVQLREFARDIAIHTFGIPPEKLGLVENSNRSTIQAADMIWSKDVLTPRLEFLRAIYQEKLIAEWDDRLIVEYVSPIREDQEHALAVATVAPWSLTQDEWREMAGKPEVENGKGKVYMVPFNLVPMTDLTEPMPAFGGGGGTLVAPPKQARLVRAAMLEGDRAIFQQAGDLAAERSLVKSVETLADLPELSRLAARLEPTMRAVFLRAVAESQAATDLEALAAAVIQGSTSLAQAAAKIDLLVTRLNGWSPTIQQGFLLGAQNGVELLTAAGIDLSFSLVSPHAVNWAATASGALITGVTDGTLAAERVIMEHGMASGESVYDTAQEIRLVIGLTERQAEAVRAFREKLLEQGLDAEAIATRTDRYAQALLRQRAQMIARTETINSANAGQQEAWQEAKRQGLIEDDRTRRVWMTADDDRVDTEWCEPLDGEEAMLGGSFTIPYGPRRGQQIFQPAAHPQCFMPDTRIVGAARALAGLKAPYSGPVVVLETRGGHRLTVTPNHPILTLRGWVQAAQLRKGDDVLSERIRFDGQLARWAEENQNRPAAIKEIVDALGCDGFRQIEIARDDLHGDAVWTQGQVEIVGADSALWDRRDRVSVQREPERFFVSADLCQAAFSTAGHPPQSRQRHDTAGARRPRTATLPLHGRAVEFQRRPLEAFGLVTAARDHAREEEPEPDSMTGDAIGIRKLFLRFASKIPRSNGRPVQIGSPVWAMPKHGSDDAPVMQAPPNEMRLDVQQASDLLIREASRIQLDRVVSVQRHEWRGHVYDLQTKDGFILAEGIIASNCRCAVALVIR